MTRTEQVSQFSEQMLALDSERFETLANILYAWSQPTVYDTLPQSEKDKIDQALDRLDKGEGIPAETVHAKLKAMLKVAGV